MNLKPNELKIYYGGGINPKLDEALRNCLGDFGYKFYASGQEIDTRIRDLAFEKKGDKND